MFGKKIETKRLIIRPWKSDDFHYYLKFCMDSEVMLPSGIRPSGNKIQGKSDFERVRRNRDAYAIVLKETGYAVGCIKFQKDIRRHCVNSISIAYELNKNYWGMGIMTEALKGMICFAFEYKRVDVIGIGHFTENDRSRRVIEKCGFIHEGLIRKSYKRFDGVVFDENSYSITREEYMENIGHYSS